MYTKSARFYDALYHFKDYMTASMELHELIQRHLPAARSLLDVACGTGKHLSFLHDYYDVEGLDINADLLMIARNRCPGIPFHLADMTDFKLDRSFDVATCLFSAIAYAKTLSNLQRTIVNIAFHIKPGGLFFLEPFFTPQNYWVDHLTANFVDEPNLKLAWMYKTAKEDRVGILDIHYLVCTQQGIEHFHEVHEVGLFTHEEHLEALSQAGFEVSWDPKGLFGRGMYIAKKAKVW